MQAISPDDITVTIFDGIGCLPVFSPDLEENEPPLTVQAFIRLISGSDGIIVSSPEYVRGIPGGMKNAIDWLVSGDQIVDKPIALVHASHRGDEMLSALRRVLSTISTNFNEALFFRFPVMNETPERIRDMLASAGHEHEAAQFLRDFSRFCRSAGTASRTG